MKALFSIATIFCILFAFAVEPAIAQRDDHGPNRGKMRERIEDLRKVKLLDVLDLQGEQVEKFFAVYNKHQAKFRELQDKVDLAARDLQGAIDRNVAESDLSEKTMEIRKQIKELERLVEVRFDDLKPVLSTKQYAQYVVFEARFRDELQRMIMDRVKKMRRD